MKKLLIIPFIAVVLFACKKDDEQPDPQGAMLNAMPLKVGNSWTYERFMVDSMGVATSENHFDSLYVSSIEVINGDTFYRVKGATPLLLASTSNPNEGILLQNSEGTIHDAAGNIFYTNNYSSTISTSSDDIFGFNLITAMAYKDSVFTVPAGTFTKTGTLLTTCFFTDPDYPNEQIRRAYYTFAEGVGLIKRRLFFFNPPYYIEYHLVSYNVN